MFIMMCGLPGCGKSYYSNNMIPNPKRILSSDDIREEFNITMQNKESHTKVFSIMHKRLIEAINNNETVIYDATNLQAKYRKNTLKQLPKDTYKKLILVCASFDKIFENNNNRDRHVPESEIIRMATTFDFPQYDEGWDEIEIICNDNKLDIDEALNSDKYAIDQNNPYHTLLLNEHIKKCAELVKQSSDDNNLVMAAKLHDIGKLYVKTTDKNGISHYYNHDKVSAYLAPLYISDTKTDTLTICNYVQNHMLNFKSMKPSTAKKYQNKFGQKFYNNLLILHNADINAI